ncbi:AI-2E family transporter [Nitrosococcus wardiae]|uniref:AI-2E family transporter n=1 Tax=Nitrosococcus wardiae TaxID=1814290 RepID=A0A4P7BYB0_9GAMM|nr:AI-2E family transporter [Nitrosococcus wardiae]QBQ55168.1 AI-2E family transporter [Nitrosococcus wardiae]
MNARRQLRFWLIGFFLFLFSVYLLREILLPFVAGMAVAYLIDPLCDWLERKGFSRTMATSLVTAGFIFVVIAVLLLLVPLLQNQIMHLIEVLPSLIARAQDSTWPWLQLLQERWSIDISQLQNAVRDQAGALIKWIGRTLASLLSSGMALANLLSLIFVTPVVAFYLLRDWDRLIARVDHLLPRKYAPVIREQVKLIDTVLSGFIRGQASVCLLLGTFYAIGLTLIGLDFGLMIGMGAGLLSFIPYVGTIVGFIAGIGLAFVQFSEWTPIALVAGVFVVGQVIEGNFLTPRLVGTRVGLHPVVVIFALLAGGALFGFLGILLAVPVAAVVGVLTRFAIKQYVASHYYLDLTPAAEADAESIYGASSEARASAEYGERRGRGIFKKRYLTLYSFVTIWHIEAPIEVVWNAISDVERWPVWWFYVERVVNLGTGDENGIGSRHHFTWRTSLPYKLSLESQVTRIEAPVFAEVIVSGDVEGWGRWYLSSAKGITTVRYDWNVRTIKPWIGWLAPMMRSIFKWNHYAIMKRGGEGLARYLGARFRGME